MTVQRKYTEQFRLKYGCNPQQKEASIYTLEESETLPFQILNGKPGYINLLDALNAWQLVQEVDLALGTPCAASFKHVSPAGVAVAVPLSPTLQKVYECEELEEISPLASAYIRARGADPMSSFGDFIALSRKVDESTARVIKTLVSDGIIAPDYDEKAFEMLQGKKKGNYVILQSSSEYVAPQQEFREIYGVGFSQNRNTLLLNEDHLLHTVVTKNQELPQTAKRDLILASIALKYTQSNSVGYAFGGQMIGIGAGQQSRIDCTKLAGRKADLWYLRQHPKVQNLPFKKEVKKVDRINARVLYIENEMTHHEQAIWSQLFTEVPPFLREEEKLEWMNTLSGVSISSDAFFPFRDNIDQASKRGVSYIVQPGGSMRDDEVIQATNEYAMVMAMSGIRLFHH